jgi:hypothetical protein
VAPPTLGEGAKIAAETEICVRIDEFTDAICPWAYSAEPFRRRLRWLYEGRIEWVPRMVVLADSPEAQLERGYDPPRWRRHVSRLAPSTGCRSPPGSADQVAAVCFKRSRRRHRVREITAGRWVDSRSRRRASKPSDRGILSAPVPL